MGCRPLSRRPTAPSKLAPRGSARSSSGHSRSALAGSSPSRTWLGLGLGLGFGIRLELGLELGLGLGFQGVVYGVGEEVREQLRSVRAVERQVSVGERLC